MARVKKQKVKRPKESRAKLRRELTNLPNLITYLRIVLIPVTLWFVVNDSPMNAAIAAFFYTIASITDALDGWLARRSGQVSMLGKFLDPLADKLCVMALLVTFVPMGRVPAWLTVVILSRELSITGLRALAAGEGIIISASDNAKMKTALQLIGIVALLIHYKYTLYLPLLTLDVDLHRVGLAFMYLSTALSLWSAGSYFRGFLRAISD